MASKTPSMVDHQRGRGQEQDLSNQQSSQVEVWEKATGMPALGGSNETVAWACRLRHQLITAAHQHAHSIGVSDHDFSEQVETSACEITSASWWIDQRDTPAADVAVLVVGAATNPQVNENPF